MSGFYNNYLALTVTPSPSYSIRLLTNTISVGLIQTEVVYDPTDVTWSDISFSNGVTATGTLSSFNGEAVQYLNHKTLVNGVFDNTQDIVFPSVPVSALIANRVAHYESQHGLVCICMNDITPQVTPNGGDIILSYAAQGIFSL